MSRVNFVQFASKCSKKAKKKTSNNGIRKMKFVFKAGRCSGRSGPNLLSFFLVFHGHLPCRPIGDDLEIIGMHHDPWTRGGIQTYININIYVLKIQQKMYKYRNGSSDILAKTSHLQPQELF